MNLIPMERKCILGRIGFAFLCTLTYLYFWGIWVEAELILRIWGAKENTFRELRNFLSGIWGDQLFQGSREHRHPSGPIKATAVFAFKVIQP